MRIIAGKYKGRKIELPKTRDVRPTADMVRAAVFNILNNLVEWPEISVLDLCCGTGAFGLEALSRGAAFVSFIDGNQESVDLTRRNIAMLGATNCDVLKSAAENLLLARRKFDVVYIDPPYFSGLVPKALKNLTVKGWLADGAVLVAEMSRKEKFEAVDGFEVTDERDYGNKKLVMLRENFLKKL